MRQIKSSQIDQNRKPWGMLIVGIYRLINHWVLSETVNAAHSLVLFSPVPPYLLCRPEQIVLWLCPSVMEAQIHRRGTGSLQCRGVVCGSKAEQSRSYENADGLASTHISSSMA